MAFSAKPSRGRGRGRGRGAAKENADFDIFGQQRQKRRNSSQPSNTNNAWSKAPSASSRSANGKPAHARFEDAGGPRSKGRAAATAPTKRPSPPQEPPPPRQPPPPREPPPLQTIPNQESEEESSSDDEVDEGIVNKILQAYGGKLGDHGDGVLSESRQNLQDACQMGANDCSVCIAKIRRTDAIWTCDSCSTSLHLQCIQKWAQEGVLQASLQRDDNDSSTPLQNLWSCPNCRTEYPMSQCPRRYTCFCKKVDNPPLHPWLAPHTCGDSCGKALRPECGHRCLLLCHPGACPPCPQTVRTKCHCGSKGPQLRRCSSRTWSCGQTCPKLLLCGQHRCSQPCHAGPCPPCPRTSQQQCLCRKKTMLRECAAPTWQCEERCDRPLPCGHHRCERVCHDGECGECPRMGVRHCPCGKTEMQLRCVEDIPPCGDTCDKQLPCGIHRCTRRCHTGSCETCLQMSRKKCRCGAREKTLPCQEEYKCDTRCTKIKNCQKHQCKRRCCSGDCPPCEQRCNKYLPCGNHKCPSLCHPGRCYPCSLMVELKCACGHARMSVRCGREKTTKPPKCKLLCKIPPDCHHPARERHLCHFNKCPTCKQVCAKGLPCGHTCPKKCHAAVVHKTVENKTRRVPWDPAPKTVVSIVNEPCPPCEYPVPVQCLGKHEISDLPCARAAPFSCKRPCARKLACTNHSCQFECHEVLGAVDSRTAGKNCQECEEGCGRERPEGCRHRCSLPCHPGDCPPCKKSNKMRCHCKAMALYVECSLWLAGDKAEREQYGSCKGPCPRLLTCGHPCSLTCHSGPCSEPSSCTFKVPRRCGCKRRKKEFSCHQVHAGKAMMECDDVCRQLKDKKAEEVEEKARLQEQERLDKEKRDLEEYNRLTSKKKKIRKRKEYVEEKTFFEKYGRLLLITVGGISVLTFLIYLLVLH